MKRSAILLLAASCLALPMLAGAQGGVLHGNGDPRTLTPTPNCAASPFYIDDSTRNLYLAATGSPCTWTPPGAGASFPGVTADGANGLLATGQLKASNLAGPLQPQNLYALNATYMAIANMYTGTGRNPSQLRLVLNGDSTAGFHNVFIVSQLAARLGSAGFDFGGILGTQFAYGQPTLSGVGQSQNSSTGVITWNDGSGSIVPGTGAPYDFTRSPKGIVANIASGGSITFGTNGSSAYGNVLKVYYLKEPTDGISGAATGTMTVTATTGATGACPAGCVIFTGSLLNGSTIGAVTQTIQAVPDNYTLTIAASGGAIDIYAVGIYNNTANGIIGAGGSGRGGLSLPDSVSTPLAVVGPWYASATGSPAVITAYSCSGTTGTFTAANSFAVGQKVTPTGFATSTFLNATPLTITSASSTQFVGTTAACSGSLAATEAGLALSSDSFDLIMFEMKQNGGTGGVGGCQQSSTAAPAVFHDYSYWLGQYTAQWMTGNTLSDFQFVTSYDDLGGCTTVFNEQERQFAQANGYFYYDNYYPVLHTKMENMGMISDSVHSTPSEQLAHSLTLFTAMGLNSFLGSEQKPVANSSTISAKFYGGTSQPTVTGLCNPATAPNCAAQISASFALYRDVSYGTNFDLSSQLNIFDYNHTNPIVCINTYGGGGVFPVGCKVTIDSSGKLVLSGALVDQFTVNCATCAVHMLFKSQQATAGGHAYFALDRGAASAVAGIDFLTAGTSQWRLGTSGSNNFSLIDQVSGRTVVTLPLNTLPTNAINGNATGVQLLTLQTATNCSSAAAPAVCAAAPAGSVAIAAAGTTVTVNTTVVTASSQIFLQEDSSLGAKLSVTCNTTTGRTYTVTARTAATSFVITASAAPTTNPACLSYTIVN